LHVVQLMPLPEDGNKQASWCEEVRVLNIGLQYWNEYKCG